MKKILVMIFALASALMADGFIIGADAGYGKVDSDLTISIPGDSVSLESNTNSKSLTVKAGYETSDYRLLGYVSTESYSDDVVVYNEGSATSVGAELDIVFDKFYAGVALGAGSKDFDTEDINFKDIGIKAGLIAELNESMNFEASIGYKWRNYDSYDIAPFTLDLDEKIIGITVGLSFNL